VRDFVSKLTAKPEPVVKVWVRSFPLKTMRREEDVALPDAAVCRGEAHFKTSLDGTEADAAARAEYPVITMETAKAASNGARIFRWLSCMSNNLSSLRWIFR
jgi:hypothetical protein